DALKGEHADIAVLERHRLAAVALRADAVESDDVTQHVVAGHLLASLAGGNGGLERPDADRVERGEAITGAIKRFALAQPDPVADQRVDLSHVLGFEAHRQAALAPAARRAERAVRS